MTESFLTKIETQGTTYDIRDAGALRDENNIITSNYIADNAIISDKITDSSIVTTKIADGAITEEKLSAELVESLANSNSGSSWIEVPITCNTLNEYQQIYLEPYGGVANNWDAMKSIFISNCPIYWNQPTSIFINPELQEARITFTGRSWTQEEINSATSSINWISGSSISESQIYMWPDSNLYIDITPELVQCVPTLVDTDKTLVSFWVYDKTLAEGNMPVPGNMEGITTYNYSSSNKFLSMKSYLTTTSPVNPSHSVPVYTFDSAGELANITINPPGQMIFTDNIPYYAIWSGVDGYLTKKIYATWDYYFKCGDFSKILPEQTS